MRESTVVLDFETRSACSIRKCGSWRYSIDPTTEVMCLAFHLPYWPTEQVELWHPAYPALGLAEQVPAELPELFYWILEGELLEAHNASFERGVWSNIMAPRFGWPKVEIRQWRDSAAKAAAHALPRALDDAINALGILTKKDLEGATLMKKLSKPRNPRKDERTAWRVKHGMTLCAACKGKGGNKIKGACPTCHGYGVLGDLTTVPEMPTLYHESVEQFERLWAYCCQDVRAEEALSARLDDLSPDETIIYTLDQTINERGFRLDREAIHAAADLIDVESADLNAELAVITEGRVLKASARAQMVAWFEEQGLILEDTQKDTITDVLTNDRDGFNANVIRALEIMQKLGQSSTAKYTAMENWICPDDRVRGGLVYHGAGTGRWTGAGVQPHNFPRGTIKGFDPDAAWALLKTRDVDAIRATYGNVLTALANGLRGVIVPSPGKVLFVADYASIEARVLLWAAEDDDHLDIFRRGEDIYCTMASSIYGRLVTKADKDERQLGKVAILGLGYQMGWAKFIDTALVMGGVVIDEDMSRKVVDTYRSEFWRVKRMWDDQQAAAIEAVRSGDVVPCGRVIWHVDGNFLFCTLPSGRRLSYAYPEVQQRPTPWGEMRAALTFMGVNPLNRKWQRMHTYGGSLVENQVQAIARDLMAAAMLRCEESKVYQPILSVHDEALAEAYPHLGSVKAFEALVAMTPDWADGLPVAAEGFSATRYRK